MWHLKDLGAIMSSSLVAQQITNVVGSLTQPPALLALGLAVAALMAVLQQALP